MARLDLTPRWREEGGPGVNSLRVSADASVVGCALADGTVSLRSLATGRVSYTLVHSPEGFAVTAFRFNPRFPRNFVTVSADGVVKMWAKKSPEAAWTGREDANALDIGSSGATMTTGGTDACIQMCHVPVRRLARRRFDMDGATGHTDRVYCVRFHPDRRGLLVSGGWDNTIQVWDARAGAGVACLFGPHVCGDAVDVRGDFVLAGSWRTREQAQMFDFRTGTARAIRWSLAADDRQCLVHSGRSDRARRWVAGPRVRRRHPRVPHARPGRVRDRAATSHFTPCLSKRRHAKALA